MGVAFTPGQTLGRGDLDIFLTNTAGNVSNAYTITFAIYWVDPVSNAEVLIGPSARQPVNPAVGEYYAAIMIPTAATPGTYHIRWTFKQYSSDPDSQVVQEFAVVAAGSNTGAGSATSSRSTCQQDLIRKLRFLIRDNAPDRNYKFRPPQGEGTVGCYNRVFGYIWEDEELAEYLEIALWKWNMHPPETEELCTVDMLCQRKPAWKAALLWGALVNAAQALAYNWVSEEFSYSIGGISLDLDRSSKYMDLKRNAEEQWDKLTEAKARTTKYIRGLQQPRFGIGIRSAFGPATGRGVLSPRNFLVWFLAVGGYGVLEALSHAHHMPHMLS